RPRDLRSSSVEFELLRPHEVSRLGNAAVIEYRRAGNRSVADQVEQLAHVELAVQAYAAVLHGEVDCPQRHMVNIQRYPRCERPRLSDQRSIRQADVAVFRLVRISLLALDGRVRETRSETSRRILVPFKIGKAFAEISQWLGPDGSRQCHP